MVDAASQGLASTYRSHKRLIRLHIVPELWKHVLGKLTAQHVRAFLNKKVASELSPRTVQCVHAVLRSAPNRAMKWQLVARNAATLVDPPRVPKAAVQALSQDDAERLLAAADGHRHEHLYAFLLATGLHLGEALALR